ncbi:MAG TPA: hypothetical protein VMT30_02435 [Candidatus Saccharimonadia bacterium]|nr:hypothetical protein [Candidatus Saccharimonadia bacterium]
MRALTFIELDVDTFDPASPVETTTFRFTYDCDYAPTDVEAIPSLTGISYSPSTISLGSDLGTRARLDVTFSDHLHIFNGEAFDSGTFWGKWRARYGQRLQGRSLRWIQGLEGQTLAEMETRHFVIESTNGPTPQNGAYTITAQDILKFADGDRSQAPLASRGFLVGSIDADDTSFTLSPVGIGDQDYPTSGYIALSGSEIVAFTRVSGSEVVTITARAQLGTDADSHAAGSRAQLVLRYVGEDVADIIRDLLVNYAGVDDAFIPLAAWQTETATYLQQVYSANIAEPTDVSKLVSEMIEQAALAVWWEPLTEQIRLQVLRGISTVAEVFGEDNTLEGTLSITEQPNTRLTQVLTYFGQRDPLAPIDEERNFRSAVLTIDGDAELAYGTPMIKKIFSRWIPFGARTVAVRLNDIILGRFRDPPRRFTFNLFRHGPENPTLGGGYRLTSWSIQDETGLASDAPIQITRLNPMSDRFEVTADEMLFRTIDPGDLLNRAITIDSSINNVNIREMHDSIYPEVTGDESPEITLTVTLETNVVVGSASSAQPSFDLGDWPAGITINIVVLGDIRGAGGTGGVGGNASGSNDGAPLNGFQGGTALYTRVPINLTDEDGKVYGGGGGGGGGAYRGGGGGGGAGVVGGIGGDVTTSTSSPSPGEVGTQDAGGAGGDGGGATDFDGGTGGAPGVVGNAGQGDALSGLTAGLGGAAGYAVDGISFVTQVGPTGDRRGQEGN